MALDVFMRQLTETGRVRVVPPTLPKDGADVDPAVAAAIRELDASVRLDAALEPPALSIPSALWAATILYRASQCFAYRFIPGEAVRELLAQRCPEAAGHGTCYSADLVLRYLPDLFSLARGLAEGDPLVAGLAVIGGEWPLSSVGMKGVGDVDISPFIDHPSLRRTYADRIIDRADVSRLNDPRAAEGVREAMGGFPELAPVIAAALRGRSDELKARPEGP